MKKWLPLNPLIKGAGAMFEQFRKGLRTIIVKHTGFIKSRADNFIDIVFGMIELGSVKHKKLALGIQGLTVLSNVRTVERFFANNTIHSEDLGFVIYDLLRLHQHGKLSLILDRTIWEYGTTCHNIFVITVVLGKTAIPITIDMLNKKGSSNFAERKKLMEEAISLIGINNIEVVLADREFIGDEWLYYLHTKIMPYIIRIKNNMYVEFNGTRIQVSALMDSVSIHERREVKVKIGDLDLRLAATRSSDGELVIVIAPRYFRGGLLKKYRVRWLIELFFRSIKSKGFNLEETHMTDPNKVKLLMAIIAVATALVVKTGIFRNQIKKIEVKKHGRAAYSIFTYGLDFFRALLKNKIIAPISTSIIASVTQPWSKMINLLFTFILGHKYVGY